MFKPGDQFIYIAKQRIFNRKVEKVEIFQNYCFITVNYDEWKSSCGFKLTFEQFNIQKGQTINVRSDYNIYELFKDIETAEAHLKTIKTCGYKTGQFLDKKTGESYMISAIYNIDGRLQIKFYPNVLCYIDELELNGFSTVPDVHPNHRKVDKDKNQSDELCVGQEFFKVTSDLDLAKYKIVEILTNVTPGCFSIQTSTMVIKLCNIFDESPKYLIFNAYGRDVPKISADALKTYGLFINIEDAKEYQKLASKGCKNCQYSK
jgi:hypothetical protein